MASIGLELTTDSPKETEYFTERGTESGTRGDTSLHLLDPDLAAVVTAWPTLNTAVRNGIIALLKSA